MHNNQATVRSSSVAAFKASIASVFSPQRAPGYSLAPSSERDCGAKILILTSEFPPFKGGIGTYALELARAAHDAGHKVTVVAPNFHQDCRAIDEALGFRVVRYTDGTPDMRGLPKRIAMTLRMLAAERFDIVHAADWPFFIAARLVPKPRASRCVLTLHGTEIWYMQARKRRAFLGLMRFWRPGWAKWISNSRYTHCQALAAFPLTDAVAKPVPLGVSSAWTDQPIDRGHARAALGLPDDALVILSLGRIVPRKGHLVLADAIELLPDELAQRVRWWIAGPLLDDAYAAQLKERQTGSQVEMSLLGPLADAEVKLRMAAADLFCLPGYKEGNTVEGFGLVFLEAAAFGVPSVATWSGGIPDAIEDGVTGLLVPERDPAALAAAIIRILGDDGLRQRMSDAAVGRARRSTWTHVMQETYAP